MDAFRETVRKYSELDNRIRELNDQVGPLRYQRNELEQELIEHLKTPALAETKHFQFQGSTFTAKGPGTWASPWSISKSDLKRQIVTYWNSGLEKDPEICFQTIVARQHEENQLKKVGVWQINRRLLSENE